MATRGRKPKPTALKVLAGVRGDRINRNEPIPISERPECPDHLCEIGRKEWDRMVPILEKSGVLSRGDGTALAIYCALFARWVRATRKINPAKPFSLDGEDEADDGDGMTDFTATGSLKVSPWVHIAASAERDMAKMLVEFGLTPSSRSRISIPDRKPVDPLAKFKKA